MATHIYMSRKRWYLFQGWQVCIWATEISNRVKVLVFLKRYCSFEGKINIVLILFNVFSIIEISDFFST